MLCRALLGSLTLDVIQELGQGQAVALHFLRVQDGARPLLDDRAAAPGSRPGPTSETRRGCPGSFLTFSSVVPEIGTPIYFTQSAKSLDETRTGSQKWPA